MWRSGYTVLIGGYVKSYGSSIREIEPCFLLLSDFCRCLRLPRDDGQRISFYSCSDDSFVTGKRLEGL